MAGKLREAFPGYGLGLIHGRLKGEEKEAQMEALRDRTIQILVATTVVEVGLDVPNATVMVVEHADRFGLSQLHQLRGRIGRGGHRGTCVLMTGRGLDPRMPSAAWISCAGRPTASASPSRTWRFGARGSSWGTRQSGDSPVPVRQHRPGPPRAGVGRPGGPGSFHLPDSGRKGRRQGPTGPVGGPVAESLRSLLRGLSSA